MIVKINGGTFRVRCRDDSQSEHFMLDGLAFLHYLHNFLLYLASYFQNSSQN